MKKHIVIFTGTLQAGGAERVISELTRKLKLYYNITLVLYYKKPIFYRIDPEIKIIEIENEINKHFLLAKAIWIRKYIKELKPDCVLSFLTPFNIFLFYSLLFVNVPLILCERNDPRYFSRNLLYIILRDIAYSCSTGVVFQTRLCQEYFANLIQNKSTVIPNACFVPVEKLGIALKIRKKHKIVTVARLHHSKNLPMLISAFYKLHLQKEFEHYKLVIYGEGPERNSLNQLIISLNLEEYVELPGKVSNILESISDAELFVLSSNFEGMPNALMEAIAVGLPVISTRVSGAEEIITDNDNGYIINVNDEISLIQRMQIILSNSELQKIMGEKSVKHALLYNFDSIAEKWRSYIDGIINNKQ